MEHSPIKIIYIVSQGHSGSTLLDAMLDCHPAIAGVGEVMRLHRALALKERCACGEPIASCPLWSRVVAKLDDSFPIERSTFAYRTFFDSIFNRERYFQETPERGYEYIDPKRFSDFNAALYRAILDVSGKSVVCDSSKDSDRAELLLSDPRFDVVLVHLARDGRGVAYSYAKKKKESAWRFFGWWAAVNIKIEFLKRRHRGAKILFMRYEDLVRDPEKQLRRILKVCGVPWSPRVLQFNDQPHHHVGSNRRFRLREGSTIAEDLSWRTGLRWREKLFFAICFSWLNRRYAKESRNQ